MYAARFHPYARPLPVARGQTNGSAGPLPTRVASGFSAARPAIPALRQSLRPLTQPYLPRATVALAATPTVKSPAPAQTTVQPALLKPTLPGAAEIQNAKAKLNEWMTKTGHHIPYTTVACEGGFQATLVLPIEGVGEAAATCVGVGTSKKVAELQAADQAMQKLMTYGLLDVLSQPSKRSLLKKSPRGAGVLAQNATSIVPAQEEFETLKQQILQMVQSKPGKRTTTYMMMCPAGEHRKRVTAALYQLAEQGLIVKHEPTSGRKLTPFWAPVGYDGPLGGGVAEDELGEGRTLPLTEVKMVIFDLVASQPGTTARDICSQTLTMGHPWDVKIINASLYSMEKDGTVEKALEQTPTGVVVRWNVKAEGVATV